MKNDERQPGPFDEQAALAELDALARELEGSRERRRLASEAFDGFLKSFNRSTPEPDSSSRQGRGGAARIPAAAPAVASSVTSAPAQAPRPPAPAAPNPTAPRRALPGPVMFGAAAIVLALLVVFFARGTDPEPQEPPSAASAQHGGDVAPPDTRVSSEPAAETAAARTELTTLRRVWVRVVVDGERLLERELPAGETVPLSPRETIVLRAGDAGAVRLAIAGKDQGPLGEEGRAVTRSFDVTALR